MHRRAGRCAGLSVLWVGSAGVWLIAPVGASAVLVFSLDNPHATGDMVRSARLGFQREDLDAVIAHYGQVLDVSRDDLENIVIAALVQSRLSESLNGSGRDLPAPAALPVRAR